METDFMANFYPIASHNFQKRVYGLDRFRLEHEKSHASFAPIASYSGAPVDYFSRWGPIIKRF